MGLIEYWDSWQALKGGMRPANELRMDWEKYEEDIGIVSQDIDVLVESLHPFNTKYVKRYANKKANSARIDALKSVKNKKEMQTWLRTYKRKDDFMDDDHMIASTVDTLIDTSSSLFATIMGYDVDNDETLKQTMSMSNLPIKYWNWQTVVHWIEKLDEFKNFASVFC